MAGRVPGEARPPKPGRGFTPAHPLPSTDIEAYRLSRKAAGLSVVSRNHDIKLLRQIWNWALRQRLIERTPFRHEHLVEIRVEHEPGRHQRFQREDDEQRLLKVESSHLHEVIVALLETACRPGEILSLQWMDVNLLQRDIVISADKAKTRRDRLVPIS